MLTCYPSNMHFPLYFLIFVQLMDIKSGTAGNLITEDFRSSNVEDPIGVESEDEFVGSDLSSFPFISPVYNYDVS